jgi:hypothetical protein
MNDQTTFRRIAAILSIVSGPVGLAAFYVVSLAVALDFELMNDTAALVSLGAGAAEVFRWGEVLGMFGYYLLLVPTALFLWRWLRLQSASLVDLYAVFGLAYLFIGAVGAALRAGVLPAMMVAYADASAANQAAIAADFRTMAVVIFVGLGALEALLGGLWLLGSGLVLRSERRSLGIVTVVLGLAYLAYGGGEWFRIEPLITLGALAFLVWPFWAVWLGVVIWRQAEHKEPALEAAHAGI